MIPGLFIFFNLLHSNFFHSKLLQPFCSILQSPSSFWFYPLSTPLHHCCFPQSHLHPQASKALTEPSSLLLLSSLRTLQRSTGQKQHAKNVNHQHPEAEPRSKEKQAKESEKIGTKGSHWFRRNLRLRITIPPSNLVAALNPLHNTLRRDFSIIVLIDETHNKAHESEYDDFIFISINREQKDTRHHSESRFELFVWIYCRDARTYYAEFLFLMEDLLSMVDLAGNLGQSFWG